jgi:tetratricopeptide (TPR) repeat protein
MLASLRAARGDTGEAERLYERATALDPADVQAWGDLGMLLVRRGAWVEATQALGRAAALDPASVALDATLGVAAARAGDQATARAALERAHARNPGDAQVTSNLAWLLATAADDAVRDPGRARALIEPLLGARPGVVEWLDTLAAAQAGLGRFDDAIDVALDARARAAARGDAATVAQLDRRLERYRAGAPYREARAGAP